MKLQFSPRTRFSTFEWDTQSQKWVRPPLGSGVLADLSKRNSLNGLLRVSFYIFLLIGAALATIYISRYSLWLALPLLYIYYFLYGFLIAVAHELQHKTVFAKNLTWLNEILFFIVQILIWYSPRHHRVSHQLHHRYTMIRGIDPETDWPEVITSKWLRKYLWGLILRILVIGAVIELYRTVKLLIQQILGKKDRMMREQCSQRDITAIRIESAAILLFHLLVISVAVWFRRWELLVFVTMAWHIGGAIEALWHQTEHIGRLYNVNDYRLCTRSVRVNSFIKLIYWGLDDHIEHHLFPGVPSYNLPKLHRILKNDLPEPKCMAVCWREMFAIAKEKDRNPDHEYVPIEL